MARKPQIKFLSGKPTNLQRAIAGYVEELVFLIQTWMFDNNREATGEAINSFRVEVRKDRFTVSTVDYMPFALQGRGPGKFPPLQNIEEWITAKRIPLDNISIKSLAFLIARKISLEGTNPPKLSDEELLEFNSRAYRKFEDRIANAVAEDVSESIALSFSKNGFKVE